MKNRSLSKYIFYLLFGFALSNCKKQDSVPPIITLNGGTTIQQILNTPWTDPGYKVADNTDGDITASVIVSGKVNKDLAGTYVITYTVADNAGNQTSATRNVIVYNEANYLSGKYLAHDTCASMTAKTYTATITPSNTINKEFIIENFGKWDSICSCVAVVKMNVSGTTVNSPLSWSKQKIANSDSLYASSNGGIITNISPAALSFSYQWTNGSSTTMCSSIYTHK